MREYQYVLFKPTKTDLSLTCPLSLPPTHPPSLPPFLPPGRPPVLPPPPWERSLWSTPSRLLLKKRPKRSKGGVLPVAQCRYGGRAGERAGGRERGREGGVGTCPIIVRAHPFFGFSLLPLYLPSRSAPSSLLGFLLRRRALPKARFGLSEGSANQNLRRVLIKMWFKWG